MAVPKTISACNNYNKTVALSFSCENSYSIVIWLNLRSNNFKFILKCFDQQDNSRVITLNYNFYPC